MRSARVAASVCAYLLANASACTEPVAHSQVRVRIVADRSIQDLIDDVQAVFETQYETGGGWLIGKSPRFEPRAGDEWPLEFTTETRGARVNYQVTATARDERGAVVVQARARRDWDDRDRNNILLRFEASCVRREVLCPKGETCHSGECIDAHYVASREEKESATPSEPTATVDAGLDPGGPTFAGEGEPCTPNGARACTGERSRTPLKCDDGSWHPAPMCGEDEMCDTSKGALRGTCRRVADECRGQAPDVVFCLRDEMRVCSSLFESENRPCEQNEHCVATPEARCECMIGFVRGVAGCERPSNCKVDNGGCDLQTTCTMQGSGRTCSDCPPGYVGTGETGCEPLLMGLETSAGTLSPAFNPEVHTYRLNVSLLAQRVKLTPSAPSAERIELNGTTIGSQQGWETPTLPLDEFPVKLTLTSSSGAASEYDVIIERSGSQTAYVKASNAGEGDNFGVALAMSGDTLVAGAFAEDSSATTIDGDQSNNSATNSGAVFVFVQRAGRWQQQAYLKSKDTAPGDYFGVKVAIDRDTLVVGAVRADLLASSGQPSRTGAAYVFSRTDGEWMQTARLTAEQDPPGNLFGASLAIDGDTLAVGASRDGGDGAVYVFTRSGDQWTQQAKLKAKAASGVSGFGAAVALSNDTLFVGSPEDDSPLSDVGSVYVFQRKASWDFQQRLVPDPASSGGSFGLQLAVRGDRALVAAPRAASLDSLAATPGEVFAYRRMGGTWVQTQRLRAILPRASDSFGSAVALTDSAALIGGCSDPSGAKGVGADAARRDSLYSGAGYLYAYENDEWTLSAYLKASNTGAYDSFGFSAALSDTAIALGANWERSKSTGVNGNEDDDSLDAAGAVYIFE